MTQNFTIRAGKSVPVDEAFEAWTSGDLPRMLGALNTKTNPIDRHYLLMGIVEQTYRRRSEPGMADECARIAELHLFEFTNLAALLKQETGFLPRVTTFQSYATLLTEQGRFDDAIAVCNRALAFGLHDNTQSGFEGRIKRIEKLRAKKAQRGAQADSPACGGSAA
jgi:hypothetical protein